MSQDRIRLFQGSQNINIATSAHDHGSKPEQDLGGSYNFTENCAITFPVTVGTGDIFLPLLCAVLMQLTPK